MNKFKIHTVQNPSNKTNNEIMEYAHKDKKLNITIRIESLILFEKEHNIFSVSKNENNKTQRILNCGRNSAITYDYIQNHLKIQKAINNLNPFKDLTENSDLQTDVLIKYFENHRQQLEKRLIIYYGI